MEKYPFGMLISVTFGCGKFNMNNMNLIDGHILFKLAEFKGKLLNFFESTINELIFEDCLFTGHVDMSLKKCKTLIVENCIIEKSFDLISSSRRIVNIECLTVLNTKNLGRIDIDWTTNNVKKMIYAQGKTTNYQDKANQFRMLKENFRNIGHYKNEDFAYVEFKRCESMSELRGEDLLHQKNKQFIQIRRCIAFPFRWFILDFVGNYATNPLRIIGFKLITIFIFAGLYTMPFVKLNGDKAFFQSTNNPLLNKFAKALYHSIETILTIGYGDVNPDNICTTLLSGFEGFLGLFLMSYFTVAFVRKILR
ncbi:potassium channel family protein [Pelotomaculum isophthalicicum JI]|uniref:Potassium channel family protein n=1 Tax=Pelotomaculum isophthalicicum JI TaxID=947010 RepID=A0A9X4JVD6_9FIRM|nr:potassium channel family protein [Pelotomaculum isophthalicicum]MDF9408126.1 potassium channel family protein [Pelotomaculum isophthalicicum JI]